MTVTNNFSGSKNATTDTFACRSSKPRSMSKSKIAKAASLAAYLVVALASGGAASVVTSTDAHAASCGGVNQKACTVFQRPGKPCNAGLKLTSVIGGKCVKPAPSPPRSKGSLKEANALKVAVAKKITRCMQSPIRLRNFRKVVKSGDYRQASRIAVQCLSQRDRNILGSPLKNTGSKQTDGIRYNTISFGVAGSIQTHFGAGVEAGVVIDLNGKVNARPYTVSEVSKGVGINLGADVVIGLSQDKLAPRKVITHDTAWVIAGKVIKGLGVSFNYDGHIPSPKSSAYDGFSVAGGVGFGFSAGSRHQQVSTIF